jgi:hypothetical protein
MAEAERIRWENGRRRLADLRPQEDNPRWIDRDGAERLKESWEEYDQVETVAVGPDGTIYNGHQRYYVLLDQHGPDFEVDVRVSSRLLSRREWQRLVVFMHEGATGDWDFDGLANWDGVDVGDLTEWGFDEGELLGRGIDLENVEFPEYDESAADAVEWIECPECGHRWPA